MAEHVYPRGSLASGGAIASLGPDSSELRYTGLQIQELGAGEEVELELSGREAIVVPLTGSVSVTIHTREGELSQWALAGRPRPWSTSDVVYAPVGSTVRLRAETAVRVAVPWAVAERAFPVQYVAASDVPVELRGAGICTRQVNNFGVPGVIAADRLIACEVLQPGGNWSSYPPHKHDRDSAHETELEEIYYFEVAPSPAGTAGFGLHRVYESEAGDIDVTAEVRTGDIVTVPRGYHGPTVAAPGHDLYYLNVMAGPRTPNHPEREWQISLDPDHAWLRDSWAGQATDPRLPFR